MVQIIAWSCQYIFETDIHLMKQFAHDWYLPCGLYTETYAFMGFDQFWNESAGLQGHEINIYVSVPIISSQV